MAAQGETLGILHVHSNPPANDSGTDEPIRSLSLSKRQLATAVAEQVGLALANSSYPRKRCEFSFAIRL